MNGINKVTLIGNLGAKPEIKYASNGSSIANLSIATNESWVDKNTNEKREKTEWHRVCLFGKLAEIAEQSLDKGSKVYLEGKLQTRKWQDKGGQDHYTTEIIVSGFNGVLQMLDGRTDTTPAKTESTKSKPVKSTGSSKDDITDFEGDEMPF